MPFMKGEIIVLLSAIALAILSQIFISNREMAIIVSTSLWLLVILHLLFHIALLEKQTR